MIGQKVSLDLIIFNLDVFVIDNQGFGEPGGTNLLRCKRKKFNIGSVQRRVPKEFEEVKELLRVGVVSHGCDKQDNRMPPI